jgi:hypothetical protein
LISKLNVDFNENIFTHVNDLSLNQFIDDDVIGNVSKNIKFNKKHLLTNIIKNLRGKKDSLNHEKINLQNIISSKPYQPRESIDEYNQFIFKFNQLKKKCKGLNTTKPTESSLSKLDLDNMKKSLNQKLIKKTNDELQVIVDKVSNNDVKGCKYNSECWACNENFGSIESKDAKKIIEFNNLYKSYILWNDYLKIQTDVELLSSYEIAYNKWKDNADSITRFNNWEDQYNIKQSTLKSITQDIVDLQFILKESYHYQCKSNEANELYKLLNNNIELFSHFTDTFKKYKSWIYNEKLLPIIVNKTNQILNTIFKDRSLELCFQFIDDNLIFTVIDEGNTINMEKLSGAQSFAV